MNKLATYPQPSRFKQTAVLIVIFATVAALSGFAIGRHPIKEANRQLAEAAADLEASSDALEKLGSERDGLKEALKLKTDEQSTLALAIRSAEREADALRSDNVSLTAALKAAAAPKPRTQTRTRATVRPITYAKGSYKALLEKYFGANAGAAYRVMMGESSGNPMAVNGPCKGLFQQDERYWAKRLAATEAKYGRDFNDSIFNPESNIAVSAYLSNGGRNWSHWSVKP